LRDGRVTEEQNTWVEFVRTRVRPVDPADLAPVLDRLEDDLTRALSEMVKWRARAEKAEAALAARERAA
jgi:hypothetical protein